MSHIRTQLDSTSLTILMVSAFSWSFNLFTFKCNDLYSKDEVNCLTICFPFLPSVFFFLYFSFLGLTEILQCSILFLLLIFFFSIDFLYKNFFLLFFFYQLFYQAISRTLIGTIPFTYQSQYNAFLHMTFYIYSTLYLLYTQHSYFPFLVFHKCNNLTTANSIYSPPTLYASVVLSFYFYTCSQPHFTGSLFLL